jgi:DNA mismatch repair protein MSH6
LILSELRPVELVQPRGLLSGETERALKEQTRNALVTKLTPGLEFWDSERTIHETISFFKENTKGTNKNSDDRIQSINEGSGSVVLPDFLRSLFDASHDGEAAICALGGCIFYLKQALLDQRLLNSGRFELLPGSDKFLEILTGDNTCFSTGDLFADKSEPFMLLDSSALENLEILENNHNGGISG